MPPALGRPLLCLITAGSGGAVCGDVVALAADAAAAGVDLVQIRERRVTDAALLSLTRKVVDEVSGTRTAVLVNDRVDVAAAAGAAGVHLRSDSVPAPRVRAIAPDGFLIGRSVHSAREAAAAEADGGLDYLIFGTVFASASKPEGHAVAGLEELSRTCETVRMPVIAIGGMTIARAREVAAAGAAGIAAIGLFRDAQRAAGGLAAVVEQLKRAFGG